MKIILKFNGNPYNLMRKLGYHPKIEDKIAKKQSFVKRLTASDYPRFHIYLNPVRDSEGRQKAQREQISNGVKPKEDKIVLNLHLDQKKPIYKGSPAHSGEYDSEVVRQEAERIKQLFSL